MKKHPKTKSGRQAKAGKVMREFYSGGLHSGSKSGPKVKSRKQAQAIAMSESGQSRGGGRSAKAREKRLEGKEL